MTDRELHRLVRHSDAVLGVAVSADARRAVSASGDKHGEGVRPEMVAVVTTFAWYAASWCCGYAGDSQDRCALRRVGFNFSS